MGSYASVEFVARCLSEGVLGRFRVEADCFLHCVRLRSTSLQTGRLKAAPQIRNPASAG